MSKNEVTKCFHCGSEKIVKRGKQFNSKKTTWKQRWQCLKCNHKFNEKKQHLVDYEPEPFEYKPKGVTPINWSNYTDSQINEKMLFLEITNDILNQFKFEQIKTNGRPVTNTKDLVFCMLIKIFNKNSARRTMSDLELLKDLGYVQAIPYFTTLMRYFDNQTFIRVFKEMVDLSAKPFADLEEDFAVDATGFSSSKFGRWLDHKYGEEVEKRLFRKLHAMIGVRSNVITSVRVTKQEGENTGDMSNFIPLVEKTAINFTIKEVSADMGYLSQANMEAVTQVGGTPYIPFKSNSRSGGNGSTWKNMNYLLKKDPQFFYEKYHKRSNVESAFWMLKQKFGDSLYTKNWTSNQNEILAKCVCHNICQIIRAYYCLGLDRTLSTEVLKSREVVIKV